MQKSEMIKEIIDEIVNYLPVDKILKVKRLLSKGFPEDQEDIEPVNQKELDDRDNVLATIFNTTETKSQMYMKIIDYLVKKGFLQKGDGSVEKPSKEDVVEVEVIDFNSDRYIVPKSRVERFKGFMIDAEEQGPNFDDEQFLNEFSDEATGGSIDQGPKLFIKR